MRTASRSPPTCKRSLRSGKASSARRASGEIVHMSGRMQLYGLTGVILCVFAFWFVRNYTVGSERVWTGMRPEALANPLLAARMLLERLGSRVEQSQDLERLTNFPANGTLFLADRSELSPPVAAALHAWVKRGGHLIVAAERRFPRDLLLRDYNIVVREVRSTNGPSTPDTITLADGTEIKAALPHTPVLFADRSHLDW